jgi:peptide/nickel transport system permease protein
VFILIVVIIGITSWMNTARVVRGEVLALKEREFVTAADALGARDGRVLGSHILPNIMSPILVSASLGMASAIITESALSFLGLGFPPDVPTWGRLLFDGRDYLGITPMRVVWPGMFISLVVLSINFMGDGIRDALDPKLRGRA